MASKRITKSAVDSAQPTDKDQFIWDDKLAGFGVKITPKGAKTFLYQFRMGGRGAPVRRLTLGKFGSLTVDKARTLAEDAAFKVAQGIDPQAEKVTKAKQAVDLAFAPYIERFHTDCLKVDWPSSHQEAKALLVRHAQPTLGKKPLPTIGKADINAVIAATRASPSTASHVFAVLRRLFNWAVEQGDIDRSPIVGMRPPPLPTARDRVLSDSELATVWKASESLGYPFTPVVRLLILTAARREEVASLGWSELDQASRTWTLPAARSKNATALVAPLSDQAVAELDALAKRTRKDGKWPKQGLLFSTTGKTSVSGYSRAKSRLDALVVKQAEKEAKASGEEVQPMEAWRIHDIRRTVATGLQRLGVRFEVTEAVLNHVGKSGSGVAAVYQRHNWADEKRAALQAWADHLTQVLSGADQSNVVKFRKRRAKRVSA